MQQLLFKRVIVSLKRSADEYHVIVGQLMSITGNMLQVRGETGMDYYFSSVYEHFSIKELTPGVMTSRGAHIGC